MTEKLSVLRWPKSCGVTPLRCESCGRRERCELVKVPPGAPGLAFVVCEDCAQLAIDPGDAA